MRGRQEPVWHGGQELECGHFFQKQRVYERSFYIIVLLLPLDWVRKGERAEMLLPCQMRPGYVSWRAPRWQQDTTKGLVHAWSYLPRLSVQIQGHHVFRAPTSPLRPTSLLKLCINHLPRVVAHEASPHPGPKQKGSPTRASHPLGNHLPTSAPLSAFPSGQGLKSILFPLTVSDCTQPWKPRFVPVALTNQ